MVIDISIPAFREEGDLWQRECGSRIAISIPAFREEGDRQGPEALVFFEKFQSPPSVRKATSAQVGY